MSGKEILRHDCPNCARLGQFSTGYESSGQVSTYCTAKARLSQCRTG